MTALTPEERAEFSDRFEALLADDVQHAVLERVMQLRDLNAAGRLTDDEVSVEVGLVTELGSTRRARVGRQDSWP